MDRGLGRFGFVVRAVVTAGLAVAGAGAMEGPASPARQRGAELLEKAVTAFGGAAAVDAVTALELKSKGTRRVQGDDLEVTTVTRYFFPDRYHQELHLPMGVMKTVAGPKEAYIVAGEGALPLPDAERQALLKLVQRHPVALLRARREAGVTAEAGGTTTVNGTPAELVKVTRGGDTVTLAIDPATGQVLQSTYPNPGGLAPPGDVVVTFSDYRKAGSIVYPHSSVGTIGGQPGFSAKIEVVVVNPALDEALFQQPAPHPMFPGEAELAKPSPKPSPTPTAQPTPAPR